MFVNLDPVHESMLREIGDSQHPSYYMEEFVHLVAKTQLESKCGIPSFQIVDNTIVLHIHHDVMQAVKDAMGI